MSDENPSIMATITATSPDLYATPPHTTKVLAEKMVM